MGRVQAAQDGPRLAQGVAAPGWRRRKHLQPLFPAWVAGSGTFPLPAGFAAFGNGREGASSDAGGRCGGLVLLL